LPLELQVIDLFSGEHYHPPYEAINPHHLAPVLQDGDFRLTESSAILKYLADKIDSPNAFLCGAQTTIADYFAAAFVSLAEAIGSDLSAYPNVRAWLGRMKALLNWGAVNQTIDGYVATLDRTAMVPV